MEYTLTNKITNKEQLCSKIELDGFEYFVIDKPIPYNSNGGTHGNFICLSEITGNEYHGNLKEGDDLYVSPFVSTVGNCGGCREIVATNNNNLELPQIIGDSTNQAIYYTSK